MTNPHDQGMYQVRFDWGTVGADAICEGAHVIVWVDQLAPSDVTGETLMVSSVDILRATLEEAQEIAELVLRRQGEMGDRFVIAVVAAGATREDGSLRFAVEDLLASGAIIEALALLGIDHQSPEAAAAAAAYTGLKNATRHLISASASSRELRESSEARAGSPS